MWSLARARRKSKSDLSLSFVPQISDYVLRYLPRIAVGDAQSLLCISQLLVDFAQLVAKKTQDTFAPVVERIFKVLAVVVGLRFKFGCCIGAHTISFRGLPMNLLPETWCYPFSFSGPLGQVAGLF